MARSRRRHRSHRRRGGMGTPVLAAIAAVLVAGVAGAFWWSGQDQKLNAVDDVTLCPVQHGPAGMTAILVDLTDPISPAQHALLTALLDKEIADAPRSTQFTMGVVTEDPADWGASAPLCKPQDRDTAGALTQNATLIGQRYRERFLAPLQADISRLTSVSGANQSPIMESLQALVADTPGFVTFDGPRRIVIVSDLLQHSDVMSFYRGGDWDSFRASPAFQRLGSTLSAADVTILQVPRPGEGVRDPRILEDFWARYFDAQGAHLPVLKRLGDL
ncbi:MAG: hypothetical protein Q4P24_17750 [Rhodobacterales bacterium]|nr:hypothetical protein [Rhodobacterales bacterium]